MKVNFDEEKRRLCIALLGLLLVAAVLWTYLWAAGLDYATERDLQDAVLSGNLPDYVVASHTSALKYRLGADYVCDGGDDDETEIIAAVKAVQGIENRWDWTTASGTPVLSKGFCSVWKEGATTWAAYSHTTGIGLASSADGKTSWTDHGEIIAKGAGGQWDETSCGVPLFFIYDSNYYCLYRGSGTGELGVGLSVCTNADPTASGNWDKIGTGTREGQLIDNNELEEGGAEDATGLIVDGGVYYLYTNSTSGDRITILLTSAEAPDAWTDVCDDNELSDEFTLVEPYPMFRGGRFCPFVWKEGAGDFRMLIAKYYVRSTSTREGVIEEWSSASPIFSQQTRTFLGVVLYSADGVLDTPEIVTTDLARDTAAYTPSRCYFDLVGSGYLYLSESVDFSHYDVPGKGKVYVKPGTYTVTPNNSATSSPALEFGYGIVVEGYGATLKLVDSHDADLDEGFIYVSDGAVLRGFTVDGNDANNTGTQVGLQVGDNGRAENITLQDFSGDGFWRCNGGRITNCISRRHGAAGVWLGYDARIRDLQVYACTGDGLEIRGDGNEALGVDCRGNTRAGLLIVGDNNQVQGVFRDNTLDGADIDGDYNRVTALMQGNLTQGYDIAGDFNQVLGGVVRDHVTGSGYGLFVAGHDNLISGVRVLNCVGATNRQNYIDGDRNRITGCWFSKGSQSINYAVYYSANAANNILTGNKHDCTIGMIEDAGTATAAQNIEGASSAALTLKQISELTTIAVGSGADPVVETTANLAPANALILGVAFRVTDAPGGDAATIDIGRSGGGNLDEFIDGASCDILAETGNSFANNDGTVTPVFNASAAKLTLTTNADVSGDDMKVRIVVFYYDITPPANNN